MILFTPTTADDIPQLEEWIARDDFHRGQSAEFWLTGAEGSQLAFCLMDDRGPVFYARVDEGDPARLHTQFAPAETVSKRRLAVGLLRALPVLVEHLKAVASAVVFESVSPTLVAFFERQGFAQVDGVNDYRMELTPGNGEGKGDGIST